MALGGKKFKNHKKIFGVVPDFIGKGARLTKGTARACVIFVALGTTWCTQKKAAPGADTVPNVPSLPTPPTGNGRGAPAPQGETAPASLPQYPQDAQPRAEPAPPIPKAPAPTVTLNGGLPLTRSAQVSVSISPAPGAETPRFMYLTHTEGCSAHGAWQPYSPQTRWTLAQLNSTARVFVKIQNENRGESDCVSGEIIHDNISPGAPVGLALAAPLTSPAQTPTPTIHVSGVESGASVTLFTNSSCTTAVGMGVANSSTIDVTLTTSLAEGSYFLYANQTDAAGNTGLCSTAHVTYVRDITPPSGPTISIASGAAYTNTTSVTLNLSAGEAPAEMYITHAAGCGSGGTWNSYATNAEWTLAQSNATATVFAKFRDWAGNETACVNDTIVHDSIVPMPPALALLSPATSPHEVTTPQFTATSIETNATLNFYGNASCSQVISSMQNVQTESVTLTTQPLAVGQHSFSVDQTDRAGNKSLCAQPVSYTVLPPNQPPVLNASGPFTIQTMLPADFNLVASDPDTQDTLTYSCASHCPTGLSVVANQVIWTPHAEQGGTFNVLFKVTDNHGAYDQKTVTFIVTDVTPPDAPSIQNVVNASAPDNRNIKVTGQVVTNGAVAVKLYRSGTCLGQPVSQVSADTWTSTGALVNLGVWDIKSSFSAQAQDAAGNTSGCSPAYVHMRIPQPIKTQTSTDASSNPSSFVTLNNLVFFVADNGINGNELWRTDGTASGTWMVKDIESNGAGTPAELVAFQGAVYFTHSDGTTGTELWKSDGTPEGTLRVKDIVPGMGSSSPTLLKAAGQKLFFRATTSAEGAELWATDGTEAGTQIVKDIRSGTGSSTPAALFNWNGLLLFQANDGTNGVELWKSDGTASGTVMVSNIRSGSSSSSPSGFVAAGAFVYFSATDGATGTELYRTDGSTAGTQIVLDIHPGTASSSPTPLGAAGQQNLLFAATTATEGRELWVTDGTSQGTSLVSDFVAGTGSSNPGFLGNLTGNSGLLLSLTTSTTGTELWKSDGSVLGTTLVKDIAPGSGSSSPVYLSASSNNSMVFFTANNGSNGVELWRTDGTASGTQLVKDINPGGGSSGATLGSYLGGAERLLFRADNGQNGTELWLSDGTTAGTHLLKNIRLPGSSLPTAATTFNQALYYSGNDGVNGIELWKSDGTEAGTVLLKNINTGAAHGNPGNFTQSGGVLYFTATSAAEGTELWKTDGTASGTVLVKDIRSGSNSSSPAQLTDVNGTLYFIANNSTNGTELWKSNGTAAGTVMVSDLVSGSGSANIQWLRALGSQVLFSASVSASGQELWISDGTASGTQLLFDINPGTGSSTPSNPIVVGSTLYFSANNGTNGAELWVTNGTAQGTQMLKDIYAGSSSSSPFGFSEIGNGTVVFFATDAASGTEIWRTDGTSSGTVQVKDIRLGSTGSSCYTMPNMAVTLNKAYFCANDGTTGTELWVTDGTAQGTQRVADMAPGALSGLAASSTLLPFASQGRVFFVANEGGSNGFDVYLFDSTHSVPEVVRIWNSPHQYWANPMIQIVGDSEIFFWGFLDNNQPTLLRQ